MDNPVYDETIRMGPTTPPENQERMFEPYYECLDTNSNRPIAAYYKGLSKATMVKDVIYDSIKDCGTHEPSEVIPSTTSDDSDNKINTLF